jgi:hypothetical protein
MLMKLGDDIAADARLDLGADDGLVFPIIEGAEHAGGIAGELSDVRVIDGAIWGAVIFYAPHGAELFHTPTLVFDQAEWESPDSRRVLTAGRLRGAAVTRKA